ncbi:hypothetical protein TPHA_0M01860 [Tetrapisispora phaffii CBS 4417]|uniref:aminodeoxychorismate synthase n=1 Tax=Tetrapisispora phaffii (strain ATCC 24235 / CBS 4417 / NBRC 1672 / NRRL Y-8282 / UCD 70-5) TaxID=1071381 RepID=G8C0P6_TETPH|nr:hypothetical protein TPHA_0M01860 [Tetrapisispora phaffii CBS 4417]CCE65761.1 hypothetical protein TPHA_0M01860 [Tetrapisispora phaffii CBS 4417]
MNQFHVLFIDSYDSFTYNVVRLIEQQIAKGYSSIHVTIIHNNSFNDINELDNYLKYFDCIVIGPGPGNPMNGLDDVGIINSLFDEKYKEIPMLGICLGFQAMCLSQDAQVKELDAIKHGQIYNIKLTGPQNSNSIFAGYPSNFNSTRYHSLHVSGWNDAIEPLAFTSDENGEVLMAAKIKNKNWFGVQYHPESCCSELGNVLIDNFLRLANEMNIESGRITLKKSLRQDSELEFNNVIKYLDKCTSIAPLYHIDEKDIASDNPIYLEEFSISQDPNYSLKLCDAINESKFLMASSSISQNRGEWSIIALPNSDSTVFTHYDQLHKTTIHKWQDPRLNTATMKESLLSLDAINHPETNGLEIVNEDKSHFWITLSHFMKDKFVKNNQDIPFIGGLIGILGYEMGNYVSNDLNPSDILIPDAKLVFIENSIVINHCSGRLYVISLSHNFPKHILKVIKNLDIAKELEWPKTLPKGTTFDIQMPSKDDYSDAFNKCQEYIHRGDSYEICLTTQTKIIPSIYLEPWKIFQTLIQQNPAPFSSYFEFNDLVDSSENNSSLCLISTSPERFLKWNNEFCELRPIKGTVKKGKKMTTEKATEILKTPKEFGENLMILDLIRNDLYELLSQVKVDEFMSVEEYKTVYQLVSVIKGFFGKERNGNSYYGLDVFRHSLPAGSMTGAPKKITVEILQNEIEKTLNKHVNGGVRGVYSGVTGYWSINNNSDWSVNIRCMYSYNRGQTWKIGAGGAITVLSTLEGEREEMFTKLESALQVFM